MKKGDIITFYQEDGKLIKTIPYPGQFDNKQRNAIGNEHFGNNWHHYRLGTHDYGGLRDKLDHYITVDRKTGLVKETHKISTS